MFLFLINVNLYSQENTEKKVEKKGTPYFKAFTNFHTDLETNNNSYKFELNRAYIGYKYTINENFSGNFCLDIDNPKNGSSLEHSAFVKYAALVYNKEKLNLAVGMIGLEHIKAQEDFWGYRYIYKSYLDLYKFSHTADIGATLKYQFTDFLKFDATIRNGEGYKKRASDNTLRAGSGLSIEPSKNLLVRIYYDIYEKGETQQTFSGFIGFKMNEKFRFGVEYNYLINDSWNADYDKWGYSLYTTYSLNEKLEIFARYDELASNILSGETESWNFNNNGKAIIGGIQYSPIKEVKTSLNYQSWISENSSINQTNSIYLNLEYKF